MPGSLTTPGRSGTRDGAPARVAFRHTYNVGAQDIFSFAAQWLAYAIPYRRFAAALTDDNARLGANVDRYSFIATDSHRLLLASLPAHIAVGTLIAERPPHRSGRAEFPHPAPTSGV